MAFGLLSTGFSAKTLSDIKTDLETEFKAQFGASINLDPESSGLGRLIGILAEREALLWDLALAVYSSADPDKATGAALEALAAITGTTRKGATKSTVTLACVGTGFGPLAAGRVVSVAGSGGAKFSSTTTTSLVVVAAWAINTPYVVGQKVVNGGKVYQCTVAGTSAGAGGPTGTGLAIVDNTVTWRYVGTGTYAADVAFESQDTGPIVAVSGTLTTIDTPVAGWVSAVNVLDAVLGTNIESDAALRIRRADELSSGGNAALNAIRANVLDVADVTACIVFENAGDVTDADGVPPHAVEVLVLGGADADIREAIFDSVAAGIATHGGVSGYVTDSAGFTHLVKFSRPTTVNIYVTVDVQKLAADFPSDGSDQIKAALVVAGDALGIGRNVVSAYLSAKIFAITGVLDVSACKIGLAPTPTLETTLVITSRQLADFDTSRIVVNLTDGTL